MEIKEIRIRLRKSQHEFSKMINVSQSQLSLIEHGIIKPNKDVMDTIRDYEGDAIMAPELQEIEDKKVFSIGVVPLHLINRFNALKKREGLSSVKMFEKLINGFS